MDEKGNSAIGSELTAVSALHFDSGPEHVSIIRPLFLLEMDMLQLWVEVQ